MMENPLRIASRESPLAMWQAGFVKDALEKLHANLKIEILGISTQADRSLELSLEALGGKGAFVKELESALLNGEADIAVHSMKDVTIDLPVDLQLPVILQREDPRDVFISNAFSGLNQLPESARVGTSSLRRRAQLKSTRPDLNIIDVRGNVGTRLRKLDAGEFDALILAAAGVKRLGMESRITETFSTELMLPAVGQGAMGIELHRNNARALALVEALSHQATQQCVEAERALNRTLGGDCHVPVAAHAEVSGASICLKGLVAELDGSKVLKADLEGPVNQAEELGRELGQRLLDMGAGEILAHLDNVRK